MSVNTTVAFIKKAQSVEGNGHMKAYRYDEARNMLAAILEDFRILSGDKMGPSDVTWQDVAGTCAVNLAVLAARIEAARLGNVVDGPVVFPSPDDLPEVK